MFRRKHWPNRGVGLSDMRRNARITAVLVIAMITALSTGCGHNELRATAHLSAFEPCNESTIRAAFLEQYPLGTDFNIIRKAHQPVEAHSKAFMVKPWTIKSEEKCVTFESQDAIPIPPAQASWIVVELKASDGKLNSIEVFRRSGVL